MTAGYSGRPLWQKLGLVDDMRACVINAPDGYYDWVSGASGAHWVPQSLGLRFVHLFTYHRAELEMQLADLRETMARDGMIWVSWPKKASKVATDVTEDTIREICLPLGLVDVKVCAVSDVWSGLKLMIRKELR